MSSKPVDTSTLISEIIKVNGLVNHHIKSFNDFVNHDMRRIMEANDKLIFPRDPEIFLRQYTKIYITKPKLMEDGSVVRLTPQSCRLGGRTYAGLVKVDIEYTKRDNKKIKAKFEKGVIIGSIPIMLKSCRCRLSSLTEDEFEKLGECPLDPGGYFIVKGHEKVILMQKELLRNHIFIGKDTNGRVTASVTSRTPEIESQTILVLENDRIYLKLKQFTKLIPIAVIIKAMGVDQDELIVRMVGREEDYQYHFESSIIECSAMSIHTKQQALDYLDGKVAHSRSETNRNTQKLQASSILRDIFLAHVPVTDGDFYPKCVYTSVMIRRIFDAVINPDSENFDDKDFIGNTRLELPGKLISMLFEDLFKTMNSIALKGLNKEYEQNMPILSFYKHIRTSFILNGIERAISTGNFDLRSPKMHIKGLSQTLNRSSFIATLAHMRQVAGEVNNKATTRELKALLANEEVRGAKILHSSEFGMFCPLEINALALLAHVTTDADESRLSSLCYSLGVEDLSICGPDIHASDSYLVMFNGRILGRHAMPEYFARNMRKLRQNGLIGEFISIFVKVKQRCIYIASDRGRVCRPLIIADNGTSRLKEEHIKSLQRGLHSLHSMLREGLFEYIDANEENNVLIALHDVGTKRSGITHIEIDPSTILGVVAGLIPYSHHTESTTLIQQCRSLKTAIGNMGYNQLHRADSKLNMLVYPQRSLVTTRSARLVGYDRLAGGQNAVVAIMSYNAYDGNSAFVLNKSSIERGFGRTISLERRTVVRQTYGPEHSDIFVKPERDKDGTMQLLDADGIASPGGIIRNNDVYLSKQTPVNISDRTTSTEREYIDTSAVYRGPEGETTVIDRVMLCSDSDNKLIVKLIFRNTRMPEVGDRFSTRHFQKGVCGAIVNQEDLPFSEQGISPDLILNPDVTVSRMAVGQMLELVSAKRGASRARFHYGCAFGEPTGYSAAVENICHQLVRAGFNYNGKDLLYSGITGSPLEAYIFMGPLYYLKSKHMVVDKMTVKTGERDPLTRQPTARGGIHFTEMDRDCLITYGASSLIYERMMLASDPYQAQVCRRCGLLGYYDHKLKRPTCSMCKNGENMATINMPYAAKLLFQELQAMNIAPRLTLKENDTLNEP